MVTSSSGWAPFEMRKRFDDLDSRIQTLGGVLLLTVWGGCLGTQGQVNQTSVYQPTHRPK